MNTEKKPLKQKTMETKRKVKKATATADKLQVKVVANIVKNKNNDVDMSIDFYIKADNDAPILTKRVFKNVHKTQPEIDTILQKQLNGMVKKSKTKIDFQTRK